MAFFIDDHKRSLLQRVVGYKKSQCRRHWLEIIRDNSPIPGSPQAILPFYDHEQSLIQRVDGNKKTMSQTLLEIIRDKPQYQDRRRQSSLFTATSGAYSSEWLAIKNQGRRHWLGMIRDIPKTRIDEINPACPSRWRSFSMQS